MATVLPKATTHLRVGSPHRVAMGSLEDSMVSLSMEGSTVEVNRTMDHPKETLDSSNFRLRVGAMSLGPVETKEQSFADAIMRDYPSLYSQTNWNLALHQSPPQ